MVCVPCACAFVVTFACHQCRDECEAFCKRAVSHAMARDGSSGGVIRTVTISKEGVSRQMYTDEQVQQHYGEMSRPGDAMTAM